MSAPCGGCPPCCKDCVFGNENGVKVKPTASVVVIMPKAEYGCIRPNGGDIVSVDGQLGMMRSGTQFHPVTERGARFLRETRNPLAIHCS